MNRAHLRTRVFVIGGVSVLGLVLVLSAVSATQPISNFVAAAPSTTILQRCASISSGALRMESKAHPCTLNERAIDWNQTGPAGSAGAAGVTGAPGATGATGLQGATGTPGAQGSAGAVGPRITFGSVGAVGQQGAVGAQGIVGSAGANGVAAANGAIGDTGATGATGAIGAAGADASPAYASGLGYGDPLTVFLTTAKGFSQKSTGAPFVAASSGVYQLSLSNYSVPSNDPNNPGSPVLVRINGNVFYVAGVRVSNQTTVSGNTILALRAGDAIDFVGATTSHRGFGFNVTLVRIDNLN